MIDFLKISFMAYGYMASAKDNATFYLMDIDGERTALDGVNITGCLQDNYLGYYFEIENGIVESRFKYYQEQKDIAGMEDIHYSNGLQHDGVVYIEEIENFIDRAIIFRYGRVRADFQIDEIKEDNRDLKSVMMEIMGYKEDNYSSFFTM